MPVAEANAGYVAWHTVPAALYAPPTPWAFGILSLIFQGGVGIVVVTEGLMAALTMK